MNGKITTKGGIDIYPPTAKRTTWIIDELFEVYEVNDINQLKI